MVRQYAPRTGNCTRLNGTGNDESLAIIGMRGIRMTEFAPPDNLCAFITFGLSSKIMINNLSVGLRGLLIEHVIIISILLAGKFEIAIRR